MKKQWFKQALAVVMAVILAVGCQIPAFGAGGAQDETMTFYVRAENDAGTILPRTQVTMKASEHKSLSEYGVQGNPPETDYITPMEVLCYALSQYEGAEYTPADLDISSSGWIHDFFGAGMDTLWFQEGVDAPSMSTTAQAQDGEEYVFIEANFESDICYTGFGFFGRLVETTEGYSAWAAEETPTATVEVGETLELTYNACGSMMFGLDGPCPDSPVYISKNGADRVTDADKTDLRTDANGKCTVSFDKPGTYIVSARYYADEEEGTRIASNAYCKVTVVSADMESIQIGDESLELSGGETDFVVLAPDDSVTLTAIALSPNATINGENLSGKEQSLTFEDGCAAVELKVQDGSLGKTYTVTVYSKAALDAQIAALPQKGDAAKELLAPETKAKADALKEILDTLSEDQLKELASAADVDVYLDVYDEVLPYKEALETLDAFVESNAFFTLADGNPADLTKVTEDLILKAEGYNAVYVTTSEWLKVEGNTLLVTRPAYGQPDVKATVTVILTPSQEIQSLQADDDLGPVVRVITFEMTILAQEKTTPEEPVEEPTEEPIENPKTGTENAVLPCLFMGAAALAAVLLTGGQKRFGNR